MKSVSKFENKSKRRRVVNVVEFSESETVYIRLDNGKKYFLNADGCWRCGSLANCFGNLGDDELEVICEFDFFGEVRSLFPLLLQDRVVKLANWLSRKIPGKMCILIETLVDAFVRAVELANLKS